LAVTGVEELNRRADLGYEKADIAEVKERQNVGEKRHAQLTGGSKR
jgi:hypothetical protein